MHAITSIFNRINLIQNMKIFITGIAGFLGSHLAEEFIKDGHEVSGNDNLLGGYLDNIPANVKFYEVDCRNLDKMSEVTRGIDVIYHCAAAPYEGLSVFSPTGIVDGIVTGTTVTLTAGIRNKIKRFIYCSSMARYGANRVPFTEDMVSAPEDPYGIAKVAGEDIVKLLCGVHGVEYVIAVPHNIIGPKQKYDDPFRNVASIMINLMLRGRQPIIYGDGLQKRCFSYVADDLYVLKKMATDNVSGEIFNIGPDEEFVTILDLAKIIAEEVGVSLAPEFYPDRTREVRLANCSADKIRKWFNYKTKWSLRDGIKEIVKYIKNRGPKNFEYHIDLEIINDKTPVTWSERKF